LANFWRRKISKSKPRSKSNPIGRPARRSDAISVYNIDPLHNEMIRCQRWGNELFRIDPEDKAALGPLTARQVAQIYPYGAETVWNHEAVCGERN
jgi:hypothetical protein